MERGVTPRVADDFLLANGHRLDILFPTTLGS